MSCWAPIWDAHAELTSMVVTYVYQSMCPLAHAAFFFFSILCFLVSIATESPHCSVCPVLPMLCCSCVPLWLLKFVGKSRKWFFGEEILTPLGDCQVSLKKVTIFEWCSWLIWYILLKIVQENYKALFKHLIPLKIWGKRNKKGKANTLCFKIVISAKLQYSTSLKLCALFNVSMKTNCGVLALNISSFTLGVLMPTVQISCVSLMDFFRGGKKKSS